MPFKKLGLNEHILKAIKDAGYNEPTPIQAAAIPEIVHNKDVIGIAQTGTGKTAAFTLPILNWLSAHPTPADTPQKTRVLIIAPTRELVAQIEENIIGYAKYLPHLKIGKIYGGVGEQPQIRALKEGCDIIIACPGRLLDLMNRGFGDFSRLTHLVLDEADRMLDMGFIHDIRKLVSKLRRQRQTLMFSATFSSDIEALTHEFQNAPIIVQIGKRSDPAKTVSQSIYEVQRHLKVNLLIHLLQDVKMEMVLVFVRTKHGADKVAKKLNIAGIKAATIHANRSQNQRMRALEDFKAWRTRVLVATDIAARGIDVDGITHVVNFDFPNIVEDYVHRIGRTGRAAAVGDAISFVSPEDKKDVAAVERKLGKPLPRKRAEGFNYQASAPQEPDRRESGPRHNRNEFGRDRDEPRRPRGPFKGKGPGKGQKNKPARPQPQGPKPKSWGQRFREFVGGGKPRRHDG